MTFSARHLHLLRAWKLPKPLKPDVKFRWILTIFWQQMTRLPEASQVGGAYDTTLSEHLQQTSTLETFTAKSSAAPVLCSICLPGANVWGSTWMCLQVWLGQGAVWAGSKGWPSRVEGSQGPGCVSDIGEEVEGPLQDRTENFPFKISHHMHLKRRTRDTFCAASWQPQHGFADGHYWAGTPGGRIPQIQDAQNADQGDFLHFHHVNVLIYRWVKASRTWLEKVAFSLAMFLAVTHQEAHEESCELVRIVDLDLKQQLA